MDALKINAEASFGLPFGPLKTGANKRTLKFYEEVKKDFPWLGLITTSDGHSFYEFCKSWTVINNLDSSSEKFFESFRKSLRESKPSTSKLSGWGFVGAIDHIIDLIWILEIAPKIGLGHSYETERPNQK